MPLQNVIYLERNWDVSVILKRLQDVPGSPHAATTFRGRFHRIMTHLLVRFLLCGWLLMAGVVSALAAPLTIGSISNDPAAEVRQFLPIVHYLAERLASQGITRGEVLVAASMREMADFLKSGRVDLYMDSSLPAAVVGQMAGGKMVLQRWKEGYSEYRSAVFVKKDGPIQTLSQLAGQRIGFKDPYSSSSYLMPRIAMEQAGLSLVEMTNIRGNVPEGKTGYLFTNDRETNLFWVITGKTVAGAMSPEELDKQARKDRDKLRIIHETETIPRHLVVLRGDLPEPLAKALVQVLLGMEQDAAGRRLLEAFEKTTRFDPIPPEHQSRLEQMTPALLAILGNPP